MRTAALAPWFISPLVLVLGAFGQEFVTVRLEAHQGGAPPAAAPARLELRLTAVADRTVAQSVTLADGRGEVSVPAGSAWDVRSGSDAYAIAATRLTAAAGAVVALELWPAATVNARVVAQNAESIPGVTMDVAALEGQENAVPRGTKFDCDRKPGGEITCSVPAAARHFVMRVPEMIPHYLWDLGLTAGSTRSLGTIAFRRGASFTAWLTREIAQQLETPARARLLHPVPAVASETAARLSVPVAEGTFDRRGFVQLAGVPAGTYVLEISAKKFAPVRIGPLEIYDGKETSFRKAIELLPPVQVRITIDPPRDAGDRPWNLQWEEIGEFAPAGSGLALQADAQGQVTIADQPPGLFSLRVLDASGNPLWRQDVRVDAQDVSVPIALDLHVVKGIVTVGETPLAATLWFGTMNSAIHARAASDADGRFTVRLPRLGEWPVEVVDRDLAIHSIVNVLAGDEEDLEIHLPDTSVSGWVVDADGQRLSRGMVTARVSGRALTAVLSPNGTFRLRGIPEGSVQLIATNARNESSAPVALQVARDAPLRDVELRLLKTRRFAGTVTSAGQPVVGAHVSIASLSPRGGAVVEAATDVNGRFDVAIAERAVRLLVVIAAPNRTLQTFDVPATDAEMRFDVAPRGGTVILRFGTDPDAPFLLARDGVEVPLPSLLAWIIAHGAPLGDESNLRVVDLAPGHYRACGGSGSCAEAVLAPGGTIELRVPE